MLSNSNSQCTILEKHYNDLQLKFQRYKENLKNQRVLDNSNAMASNAIFEITLLKGQLQERDKTVRNLQSEINISKMLNLGGNDDSTASSVNVQALETELCQIENDALKVTNANVHGCYKELTLSNTYLRNSSVETIKAQKAEITSLKAKRVKPAFGASKPGPKSNAWIYRRLSARSGRGEKVAAHLRTLNKQNHVDSSFKRFVSVKNAGCDVCHRCLNIDSYDNRVFNSMNSGHPITCHVMSILQVVQIVLWYLDSGCSKHMTGDRKRLINFVEKFIGTVRFGNDQVAKIVGYGDYQMGETIISRVYYVEGLKHNL
nr:integrase, catalytic region, zinc finger, CCHC-type, peptidase aspartic, catalytic [Tanacetum cinerariifolium]